MHAHLVVLNRKPHTSSRLSWPWVFEVILVFIGRPGHVLSTDEILIKSHGLKEPYLRRLSPSDWLKETVSQWLYTWRNANPCPRALVPPGNFMACATNDVWHVCCHAVGSYFGLFPMTKSETGRCGHHKQGGLHPTMSIEQQEIWSDGCLI